MSSTSNDKIKEVLRSLDPSKDVQWTNEGYPKLEVVRFLLKDPAITRDDLVAADPLFSRSALAEEVAAANKGGESTVTQNETGLSIELTPEEQIAAAQAEISAAEKAADEAALKLRQAQLKKDTLLAEHAETQHDPLSTALSDYFRQADIDRGQRADVLARVNAAIPPVAPIDAVRAKNNRRGV